MNRLDFVYICMHKRCMVTAEYSASYSKITSMYVCVCVLFLRSFGSSKTFLWHLRLFLVTMLILTLGTFMAFASARDLAGTRSGSTFVLHSHLEAKKSFFGLLFRAASRRDILDRDFHPSTVKPRSPSYCSKAPSP